jgi:hypothetical protein
MKNRWGLWNRVAGFTGIGVAVLLLVAIPSLPNAAAFESDGNPIASQNYRFASNVPQDMRDRMTAVALEYTTAAEGGLFYNGLSTNVVGFTVYEEEGKVGDGTQGCSGSNCRLNLDYNMYICDEFYFGVGANAGVSNSPWPWCPPPETRTDAWGVLVHEAGHWRGLNHDLYGVCQGSGPNPAISLYAPKPTSEMASMCYSAGEPAIEGSSGSAGIVPRRTISQDEIQGIRAQLIGDFVANHDLDLCSGCSWDDEPDYWQITNNANSWWGGGSNKIVSLNNNPTVPYPELFQRVRGDDADADNDGSFQVTARVKARDNQVNPRVVIFVRHVHSSHLVNHEMKCDSGTLPLNQWKTVSCLIDLYNNPVLEFEYGVRVTEKIDIDWVTVADK